MPKIKQKIPKEIIKITNKLQNAGFEAYLVGGCVRDLLLEKEPKDWDIATNARPDDIMALFEKTHYENQFGTVRVVNDETKDERLKVVEVTTYRTEGKYSDKRRPDEVKFAQTIEEDLSRRDFTINAIGLALPAEIIKDISYDKGHLIDLYEGIKDIKEKVIRSVLDPKERFAEDALRMIRAVRLVGELDFNIEKETMEAIKVARKNLEEISTERIGEEFEKIIMSENPQKSMEMAKNLDILEYIAPELLEGEGVGQPKTHKYDVLEHSLRTLQASADKGFSLEVRLAALFHDIAKPRTRRISKEKGKPTFYGHEVVGGRMTRQILDRLRFPSKIVQRTSNLARWHMFFSDTEEITHSAVRRLISNVGRENVKDLINLRICDRIGTGRPKEEPYRLRKYQAMIEEVLRDPTSVGQLKIGGNDIMKRFLVKPGPKIGFVLHALLDEVLEKPELNTKKFLVKRAGEFLNLPDDELVALGKRGKMSKEKEEEQKVKDIRRRYFVE